MVKAKIKGISHSNDWLFSQNPTENTSAMFHMAYSKIKYIKQLNKFIMIQNIFYYLCQSELFLFSVNHC